MLKINLKKITCGTALVLGFLFFSLPSALAYVAVNNESDTINEALGIEMPLSTERWYLGTLTNFSEIYRLTLAEDFPMLLSLRMPSTMDIEAMRPALLLVRIIEPEGVEEVVRLVFDGEEWEKQKDPLSRLSFYTTTPLALDLPAGDYRIEVSAVNDGGKYMLVVGSDGDSESYTTAFATVRTLHKFYELPVILMIRSPLVHYPLGIVFIIGLMVFTWRYRESIKIT